MHWRSQVCLEGGLKVHIMIEVSRTGVPTGTHGRAGSIVIPHNAGLKIRKIFNCTITPKRRRRRRKGRGARGGGVWVFPSPLGEVWKGDCALSPEKFSILKLKMESFGAFWALLFTVQLPVLHAKNWYTWAWKTCSNYTQCTAINQSINQ